MRIKAGRIDANTDFDVVATAADFLNSSMGYSPTIMEFPSYPQPQFGVDISASPGKDFKLSAGEFGTLRGKILIAEASRPWRTSGHHAGRAAFGAWRLHEPIMCVDDTETSHTSGYYSVVEQTIWQRSSAETKDNAQSLAVFTQIGTGDGRANPARLHLGSGLVLAAPFRRRSADSVGVAATWLRFTSDPCAGYDARGELVAESYYKLSIGHATSLVTDVQYFHDPGGNSANSDSLIVTPRLVVTF